jgi:K+-sensing histidine kinase KdpD
MIGFERMINAVHKLKNQAQLKENFIAGMIHDIRNPLSSMICSLDFVKENEKIQEDENVSNMIEIASHCAEFIISQVSNFLDISKLEHSNLQMCPTPTEVIEMIRKIV